MKPKLLPFLILCVVILGIFWYAYRHTKPDYTLPFDDQNFTVTETCPDGSTKTVVSGDGRKALRFDCPKETPTAIPDTEWECQPGWKCT